MRHFLDLHTTSADELKGIIASARAMKDARAGWGRAVPDAGAPLAGRMVASMLINAIRFHGDDPAR